ncbi:hypothetical protein PLESTF_000711900 [Pleodorina starrii]|nr:hypothetical protein PLESTM_001800900 [Pleodorina starrii]GLC68591.1 hypothetical protein PLESTF_000711900 [Pleodorina starrii]
MPAAEPYTTKAGVVKNPGSLGITWDYLAGTNGETGFGSKSTAEQVSAGWDGRGRVALITGAATGLGYESARVLAQRGAHVVVAVRSQARAEETASRLRRDVPGAQVTPLELDLSSLASVRQAAADFKRTGLPLHILLLNAGVMACPMGRSRDGFELQWATNHLGHFALTTRLLDVMIASASAPDTAQQGSGGSGGGMEGRVVVLSSMGHHLFQVPGGINFEALRSGADYEPFKAYGVSKLSNVLFARELQRRLAGKPVVAVCCHPGVIFETELSRHMNGTAARKAATEGAGASPSSPSSGCTWKQRLNDMGMAVTAFLFKPIAKSVQQGAATQVLLATSARVVPGEYYSDCNPAPSSAASLDGELGARLWAFSEEAVRQAEQPEQVQQ